MKRCLGGRLTQLVHENGRTFPLKPRTTSAVWKTMLEYQVNLSVGVHIRMPQQRVTANSYAEVRRLLVKDCFDLNDSLPRSRKRWWSSGRSAVSHRAPSCCWQGFNLRKDKNVYCSWQNAAFYQWKPGDLCSMFQCISWCPFSDCLAQLFHFGWNLNMIQLLKLSHPVFLKSNC